jgi:hypothetical protein
VEVASELVDDADLRGRAEHALRATVGCSIGVVLRPGTVPRSEGGKLQRIDDRR